MPTVQRIPRRDYIKQHDSFYNSAPWRNLRRWHLSNNPLCFYCQLSGHVKAGNICDHFRPKRIFPELSLDAGNMRTACERCHNIKRVWEKRIVTQDQFEKGIEEFIDRSFRNAA